MSTPATAADSPSAASAPRFAREEINALRQLDNTTNIRVIAVTWLVIAVTVAAAVRDAPLHFCSEVCTNRSYSPYWLLTRDLATSSPSGDQASSSFAPSRHQITADRPHLGFGCAPAGFEVAHNSEIDLIDFQSFVDGQIFEPTGHVSAGNGLVQPGTHVAAFHNTEVRS